MSLEKQLKWDAYYMKLAITASEQGSCDRAKVGCVLVSRLNSVLATGYNGAMRGSPHCDEVGHLMYQNGCIRTAHSECNAVAQAAREGRPTEGSTAYVTLSPCVSCLKLLVQAGVTRIVYLNEYRIMDETLALVATLPGESLRFEKFEKANLGLENKEEA